MSTLPNVTDASFESDVLQATQPVLVDFWAAWCGPCQLLAPVLEEAAPEYADKLKIVKLDVDANPNTAKQYGVRGIPTLLLFKEGEVVATHTGMMVKSQLTAFISSIL